MRNKRFIISILTVAILSLLPLMVDGLHPTSAKHSQGLQQHKLKGLMADLKVQPLPSIDLPNFSLPDSAGNTFETKNHTGKVLLLNFWTTH
jgi:cytochrome oxidase Cu insertion factor (SCO1/SenC/PrrC family)